MPQGDPQVYQSSGRWTPSPWITHHSERIGLEQAAVKPEPHTQTDSLCLQVLPPLKDVKIRPEVGSMLRNKLVRLMTHVDMGVKQTAAEFLFVLCKESGERDDGLAPPSPVQPRVLNVFLFDDVIAQWTTC